MELGNTHARHMRTQFHLVIRQKHSERNKINQTNKQTPQLILGALNTAHMQCCFTAALQNSTLPCFKARKFYALLREISFLLPACKMAQSTQ